MKRVHCLNLRVVLLALVPVRSTKCCIQNCHIVMTFANLCGALFCLACAAVTASAQELPPAIQVDRLLLQTEEQIRDERYATALATLDKIRELRIQHELQTPGAFWLKHARVAMAAGSAVKANESVIRYLELTGQEGENYMEALELLNEVEERLAAIAAREQAAAAPHQARQHSIADGQQARQRLLAQAQAAAPGNVFRDCAVCPVIVEVPAGSFTMGSPSTEDGRISDEGPQHRVMIGSSFAVGVYEVTFAEWDACVDGGGCQGHHPSDHGRGRGLRPVVYVNWDDAQEYVQWLSRETGEQYRLLTEAEWEYVARAVAQPGTQTARYWGASSSGQCRYANGYDRTGAEKHDFSWDSVSCSDGYADTAPVGSFEPNAFGLHDVLGNVWEWTEDCWNGDYSGAPTNGRAWESGNCSQRVLRGGSWFSYPRLLRSAYRLWDSAGYRSSSLGFRVARTTN